MEQVEVLGQTSVFNNSSQEIEELYETCFPTVARYVSKKGGTQDEAKDIFQDALVIFFEKCSEPSFKLTSMPEAYVLGIVKHLWIRNFHRGIKHISLEEPGREPLIPEDYYPSPDSLKLLTLLEQTGKRCLDILRAFYFEKLSMKEAALHLGYAGERSVTVQKYKCLEKVRDSIKEKSLTYEDFFE